jgi:hypothetical protein
MDIGFELGLVLAGISYLILRAIDVRTARDRVGLDEAAAVGGK